MLFFPEAVVPVMAAEGQVAAGLGFVSVFFWWICFTCSASLVWWFPEDTRGSCWFQADALNTEPFRQTFFCLNLSDRH